MKPRRILANPSLRDPRRARAGIMLVAVVLCAGCSGKSAAREEPKRDPHDMTGAAGAAGAAGNGAPIATGEIRALWQLNHEPVLDDVVFIDSKFVCGPSAELCAEASDEDGDPLELLLLPAQHCSVSAHPPELEARAARGEPSWMRQCWTLACHELGEIDLDIVVYDLIEQAGELLRFDALVTELGVSSRSELALSAHFEGTLLWPDRDRDGQGDTHLLAAIACEDAASEGWVTNDEDCDDDDDGVHARAAEQCGDLKDNNCDGFAEEKCILDMRAAAQQPGTAR